MSDPRFARLRTDPRFRRPKKSKQKVVVDERFKAIFDDGDKNASKRKSKGGRVDKYGRQISDTHEKEDLRRFYRLDHQEDSDEEHVKDTEDQNSEIVDYARGQVLLESSDDENDDEDQSADQESEVDDGEVTLGRHASKPIPVFAEEEADEYLEIDLNEDEDAYADLDAQAAAYTAQHANNEGAVNGEEHEQQTGTKTSRIAVVNLDWDHVRASHLFKIFSSLVSPTAPSASVAVNATTASRKDGDVNGDENEKTSPAKIVRGKVLNVRVYPSEFGKDRLKREEAEGPPKEIYKKSRRDDVLGSLIQEDDGDPFDEKALRKYQLERLRYYYAIATCDTVEAAAHIVSELDGTELERSANVFDSSFVPDDMTFDDDFRDEATSATEAANTTYKPLDFSTDALRHSKVTLKWDEDDPERSKITRRTLSRKEIEEGDFRAYIASSSSEDEDEDLNDDKSTKSKAERERIRKLLLGDSGGTNDLEDANPFVDEDKGADGDVEITFMPGLSEANANAGEETTIDAYKRKQKERRLARKKEKKEKENQGDEKAKDSGGRKAKLIDDDFFAAGSESEKEEELDTRKKPKSKKKASKNDDEAEASTETRPATEAELSLLTTPDDASSERKHFDMKAILKAEKAKRRKRDRKKNKKSKGADEDETQEDFQIDVKDERFRALHEDHTFAIDPSNPHFKKTKSMAALLDERTRRQSGKEVTSETKKSARSDGSTPSQSLQRLVESVKRKSSGVEGKSMGKRRKL